MKRILAVMIGLCAMSSLWALDKVPLPKSIAGETRQDCSVCPEMVGIPEGSFKMGSNDYDDEKPIQEWKIGEFYMSKYETTFEEYDAFANATGRSEPKDSGWGRGKRPVIDVSWEDAVAYGEWLSKKTGKTYRLPTEAEWEYAARGGSTTKYWWGDNIGSNKANCDGCGSQWDNKQTAPVGSFSSNGFGLYDTVGNVREWTCSEYGSYSEGKQTQCNQTVTGRRVLRGGSWGDGASFVRSAGRNFDVATDRSAALGFRLISSP
ncbi:MAG: formylglycine-generating enzyme family protein [Thiotrichaceae bacterium]|nr:formylglycine-generating enzyme family protein [Thiotrichaceae bacterium]